MVKKTGGKKAGGKKGGNTKKAAPGGKQGGAAAAAAGKKKKKQQAPQPAAKAGNKKKQNNNNKNKDLIGRSELVSTDAADHALPMVQQLAKAAFPHRNANEGDPEVLDCPSVSLSYTYLNMDGYRTDVDLWFTNGPRVKREYYGIGRGPKEEVLCELPHIALLPPEEGKLYDLGERCFHGQPVDDLRMNCNRWFVGIENGYLYFCPDFKSGDLEEELFRIPLDKYVEEVSKQYKANYKHINSCTDSSQWMFDD